MILETTDFSKYSTNRYFVQYLLKGTLIITPKNQQ